MPRRAKSAKRDRQSAPAEESTIKFRATLIPGDGIGPEVVDAAVRVVSATGVQTEGERAEAEADVFLEHGTAMPDKANPTAVIRSAAQLIAHLGTTKAAARIESAAKTELSNPANQTGGLRDKATTDPFTDAILVELEG